MEPENSPKKEEEKDNQGNQENQAKLPSSDFYAKLLHLPPCKTGGECNNCGRCER